MEVVLPESIGLAVGQRRDSVVIVFQEGLDLTPAQMNHGMPAVIGLA